MKYKEYVALQNQTTFIDIKVERAVEAKLEMLIPEIREQVRGEIELGNSFANFHQLNQLKKELEKLNKQIDDLQDEKLMFEKQTQVFELLAKNCGHEAEYSEYMRSMYTKTALINMQNNSHSKSLQKYLALPNIQFISSLKVQKV